MGTSMNFYRLNVDLLESGKYLKLSVTWEPTSVWVSLPGNPDDPHDNEPRGSHSRLRQEAVRADIFKYTQSVSHNECLLSNKKILYQSLTSPRSKSDLPNWSSL